MELSAPTLAASVADQEMNRSDYSARFITDSRLGNYSMPSARPLPARQGHVSNQEDAEISGGFLLPGTPRTALG